MYDVAYGRTNHDQRSNFVEDRVYLQAFQSICRATAYDLGAYFASIFRAVNVLTMWSRDV